MKKVILLGDSIRQIGYGPRVAQLLAGECTLWQPEDNCRFAQYTLRGVCAEWDGELAGADVIHWNNGLWDICDYGLEDGGVFTSLDAYLDTMVRIAKVLKKTAKTVIFATSTPVTEKNTLMHNGDIVRYNEAVVPVLRELGVQINDLHSLVQPHVDSYIRTDDDTHLTEAGIEACAAQVARVIRQALR